MHKLYDLKEKLLDELESYADNGKITPNTIEEIKYLASAADHIGNICESCEEDEMSYDDGMNMGGNMGGTSNRGYSRYSNRGRSYRGSSYRGRGSNARRDSMGRYSGADGDMDTIKQEVRRLADKVEQM